MIGVIAQKNEVELVGEFFELFKTPWEYYQENQTYDVVLITTEMQREVEAKLLLVYGSEEYSFDRRHKLKLLGAKNASTLRYMDAVVPIYGRVGVFQEIIDPIIQTAETEEAVAISFNTAHGKVIRIGFDLFQEVAHSLWHGQPLEYAQIPTLDMHIAMLRDWIVGAGLPVVEVPNRPAEFDFTVCLTHDVDFLRISNHKFDHTLIGFVYRGLFGSLTSFLKRKISLGKLLKNWKAVCLLPGVYLGIVKDYFWQFDRYLAVEKGLASTFFILPFKNKPGVDSSGQIHKIRAAQYDIDDIKPEIEQLIAAGREIALHGIDAWRDTAQGQVERQRISSVTGHHRIGVRSHWLYQCPRSPQNLDEAGFVYDSSVGYNENVGYRSGTTQVYSPPNVKQLLELPLHIMDTALFYSGRMNLAESQALVLVKGIIANTQRFGGVLTINWHHRSMGPERLWDHFYEIIVSHLKRKQVWFATAQEAVSWFRARRSVTFRDVRVRDNELSVRLSSQPYDGPRLLLRVHVPRHWGDQRGRLIEEGPRRADVPFSGDMETTIPI